MTTDFGTTDGYTGVVKGVILSIAPQITIVDITHDLPAFDIVAGAWILNNSWRFFPKGTIHMAVVDPGVGSSQRGLIVESESATLVGPDNGLFSLVLAEEQDWRAYVIENRTYARGEISSSFHARDIYAPAAAHLSLGVGAKAIGKSVPLNELSSLSYAKPLVSERRVLGEVVYIDTFGNLITNIPGSYAKSGHALLLNDRPVCQIGKTYSSAAPGEPIAFAGSHGCLEIAICQGSAMELLQAKRRTPVSVTLETGQ